MLRSRTALAVGTIWAAVVLAVPPAARADDPFEGLPSKVGLVSVKVAKPSPSGCFGQSDDPFRGFATDVRGPAATRCERFVPSVFVKAQLWERRIWGWDRFGQPDQAQEANQSDVVAVATSECRDNRFRTTGDHAATDVDFDTYRARTSTGGNDIRC
jgi:hypothetical protein